MCFLEVYHSFMLSQTTTTTHYPEAKRRISLRVTLTILPPTPHFAILVENQIFPFSFFSLPSINPRPHPAVQAVLGLHLSVCSQQSSHRTGVCLNIALTAPMVRGRLCHNGLGCFLAGIKAHVLRGGLCKATEPWEPVNQLG